MAKLPVDHLSSSQLTLARMCLRLLEYVEVKKRKQRPDALRARGKACHAVAADDLKHKKETGRLMPDEKVLDLARDHFATESYEVDWKHEDAEPGEAQDETIGMARTHHTLIAPAIHPLHVEKRMERPFGGLPLTLLGYVDVVDGQADGGPIWIRDLKTTKAAPDGAAKGRVSHSETAKHASQLVTYRMLFAKEANGRAVRTSLDYLWPTKGGQAICAPVDVTRNDVRLTLEDYAALIRLYEAGVYPRTGRGSWVCTEARCAFYAECILGRSRALDL